MTVGVRSRWLAVASAAVLALVGCTGQEPGPVGPSGSPTVVVSPGPGTGSGTPEPSASPQSEDERAVADAIEIYKAFIHASHEFAHTPSDDALYERVLALTTEDGPARSAAQADAEHMRDNGLSVTGYPTIKRVSTSSVHLEDDFIQLAACLDVSQLVPSGGRVPDQPEQTIEQIEMHRVNARWLVHYLDGEAGEC